MTSSPPAAQALTKLDDKGRCCGRKPLHYKGGSWRSPRGAPMFFCCECNREFGPDGQQRSNWAWPARGRRPEDDEAYEALDQDAP